MLSCLVFFQVVQFQLIIVYQGGMVEGVYRFSNLYQSDDSQRVPILPGDSASDGRNSKTDQDEAMGQPTAPRRSLSSL